MVTKRERLKAGGEGDDRGWGGWMASPTQWTWVWVDSGSWWWTGRPGMLWFMDLQRVGHDWVTEMNLTEAPGLVVKRLPASAGDMGLIPDSGRSYMLQGKEAQVPQLLSLCSRSQEPQILIPCASITQAFMSLSATREATSMRSPNTAMKSSPRSP